MDQHNGLVVSGGGEDLGLASRDVGVAGNDLGHDTTGGLDTESQGVDISEKDTSGSLLTRQDTTLNSGAESDSLIGVDTLGSLLTAKVLLEKSLDLGNTGGTTDKDDIVDVRLLDLGILDDLLDGLESALEEIHVELLKLGPGEGLGEVLAVMESLNFNPGGHLAGQGTLGLLNLTLELAHGLEVLGDVDVVLLVVELGEVVDDTVIEILTSEMSITGSSLDLEETVLDGEEGDIESTSTEIVDDDLALITLLVKTVGKGSGGGLVDNAEDVETGNDTGILGGLALVVVEVGRDGDDGVGDGLAEVGLSNLLHLAENHGGDLLGGEGTVGTLVLDLDNGLSVLVDDLEGEVLHVLLDILVVKGTTNETPN